MRMARLELARTMPHAPQACAYTNSATSAQTLKHYNTFFLNDPTIKFLRNIKSVLLVINNIDKIKQLTMIKNCKAMKNKLDYFSLVSIFLLTFASFLNLKSVNAQKVVFDEKKCLQGFVTQGLTADKAKIWCNYKQDCLKESQKEGLPVDTAQSVCECTINEYKKRYSIQQFQNLTQQIKTNPAVEEKLREVGETCLDNILFEE